MLQLAVMIRKSWFLSLGFPLCFCRANTAFFPAFQNHPNCDKKKTMTKNEHCVAKERCD